jgi:transitional endoplasmic reticulum ATPase
MAEITQEDRNREQIMNTLAQLGSLTVQDDGLIFDGTRIILPKQMEGNILQVVRFLMKWQEAQDATFDFTKTFNYRPWDGANAFQLAMRKVFGTAGIGTSIQTMFGEIKPEFKTVNVGPKETLQIPWNRVNLSLLNASFYLGMTRSREYGTVFEIKVEAPRKYRAHIEAFFQVMEDILKKESIYKGKAFTGGSEPLFLDIDAVDPEKVVYSQEAQTQLDVNMWSLLRHSDTMRKNNIPLKRAVLVEGPYGTGKTLAGLLTAKEAVAHGWTFILARPGQDDVEEVLKTAQLYAPSVVWYEDIDNIAEGDSKLQISKLLDTLDGAQAKNGEVLAGFTTNHVDKIQKGVLRPGRLDAVIHIGDLDAAGFEKLVRATVGDLLGDVDFAKVAEAFKGFLPAFVTEASNRAQMYSISRNAGNPEKINTDDLVHAANGLRPQHELMQEAKEGATQPQIESALKVMLTDVANRTAWVDRDGDAVGYFSKVQPEDAKLPGEGS